MARPLQNGPGVKFLALVVALAATGCGEVTEIPDLPYDDRYGDRTEMDVYLPPEYRADRPAVLLIHGGGWRSFSKDVYVDHARRLAKAGYAVAAINYRLVPDGVYPKPVRDCACALSFFRAQAVEFGFDPDRVAVAGYSAGGHLASLLGVAIDDPEHKPDCPAGPTFPPRAVVSGAGPEDMWEMPEVDVVTEFMGGTREEIPERYDLASPIHHVAPGAPPFLFVHGTDDWFVDFAQSERMRDALAEVGADARLLAIPGGGHIVNPGADLGDAHTVIASTDAPEAWAAILDFFDDTIGAP